MQAFPISPREMLASAWRHRGLIAALVRREIAARYRGSVFGMLWSLLTPILMLMIYTFVFSVVFKARWNAGSDSKTEFALMLFAGLMVFSLLSECINRAPGLVIGNTNYVKKVIFPLEILPVVALGSAAFNLAINLLVWLLAHLVFFGTLHASLVFLPIVLLPLVLMTLGGSWLLAALGVFLRDSGQVVSVLMSILLFVSPIFYPVAALPEAYRGYLQLNPLTGVVEQTRAVLFLGQTPDFVQLGFSLTGAAIFCWLGFALFQKTRKGFADVL